MKIIPCVASCVQPGTSPLPLVSAWLLKWPGKQSSNAVVAKNPETLKILRLRQGWLATLFSREQLVKVAEATHTHTHNNHAQQAAQAAVSCCGDGHAQQGPASNVATAQSVPERGRVPPPANPSASTTNRLMVGLLLGAPSGSNRTHLSPLSISYSTRFSDAQGLCNFLTCKRCFFCSSGGQHPHLQSGVGRTHPGPPGRPPASHWHRGRARDSGCLRKLRKRLRRANALRKAGRSTPGAARHHFTSAPAP